MSFFKYVATRWALVLGLIIITAGVCMAAAAALVLITETYGTFVGVSFLAAGVVFIISIAMYLDYREGR